MFFICFLNHYLIMLFFLFEGVYSVNDKLVSQSPKEQLSKPNSKVSLTFSHKIPSYDTILWYRCSPGDTALILIAYMYYKDPTVEQPFVDRFNVSGDGEKEAFLHLLDLRPEDRGVYFGAASCLQRMWTKSSLLDIMNTSHARSCL
uniref:Immunoglobulin V-set domain-containing protein n=1 Tax=Gouania willdenowi TaxID=441366 RepID=A0A8C5DIL7_GOUWI